jgi:predicted DNA-binding WGR domain protein
MRRQFELSEGKSHKCWSIETSGTSFTVRYGRIGTEGKTLSKSFAAVAVMRAAADKIIGEKLDKGYLEVGAPAPEPMDEEVFWRLIAMFNWKKTGDDDAVLKPCVTALARMTEKDIYTFDDILAAKLYALDTREVSRAVYRGQSDPDDGDAYISPDDFLYSRCVMVANGKTFYETVLADPSKAPQEMEFEALLYVAGTAYEKKHPGNTYDHLTKVSWESFSNEDGWKATKKTKPGKFTAKAIPPMNRRPT